MQPDFFPSHPSAQTAVLLASFNTPDRDHVALVLRETNTPRSLYTLARILRTAQMVDQINAARAAVVAKAA
jgi:hypothetical protein